MNKSVYILHRIYYIYCIYCIRYLHDTIYITAIPQYHKPPPTPRGTLYDHPAWGGGGGDQPTLHHIYIHIKWWYDIKMDFKWILFWLSNQSNQNPMISPAGSNGTFFMPHGDWRIERKDSRCGNCLFGVEMGPLLAQHVWYQPKILIWFHVFFSFWMVNQPKISKIHHFE